MRELVPLPFRGAEIPLYADEDRGCFVPIGAICRVLGLDERAQRRRIGRRPLLAKGGAIMASPSAGGVQETFCLRADAAALWLLLMQASRVAPERREMLIAFQEEFAGTLFRHLMLRRAAVLGSAPMSEWRAARQTFNRQRFAAIRFQSRRFDECTLEPEE